MKTLLLSLTAILFSSLLAAQGISVSIDSSLPLNSNGVLQVCPDDPFTLTAIVDYGSTGGSIETTEFAWSMADGENPGSFGNDQRTLSLPFLTGVIIHLSIHDTISNSTATASLAVEVSGEPDMSGFLSTNPNWVQLGEQVELNASLSPTDPGYIPPFSNSYYSGGMYLYTIFLPDGSGVSYESSITISGASEEALIESASDIQQIWSDMEHSYLGDLDIELFCPNGSTVILQDQGGGSCNLGFPWATAPVDGNSSVTTPGQGLVYSWNMDGQGTLDEGCIDGIEFISSDGPETYTDSQVAEGLYAPFQSFEGLVGCPVNGEWTMRFTDNIGADNGWSFGWGITFSPDILTPPGDYEILGQEISWTSDPSIISMNAGNIIAEPTTPGPMEYELVFTDEAGCEFDFLYPIFVEDPNGLSEMEALGLSIRAQGRMLMINSDLLDDEDALVEVFDLSGKRIHSENFYTGMRVDLPVAGIYLIQVRTIKGEAASLKVRVD